MDRLRNGLLALGVLLGTSAFGQDAPQTTQQSAAAPTITIPSYPDTTRGLEKLLNDMMKLSKEIDNQALAAYANSLLIPNPDDWFKIVFGGDLGPRYAAASEQSRSTTEKSVPATLATMLKENRTNIRAHRFESSCDQYATEKEYPLLLRRKQPVPLYDARFLDYASNTESIWSYFAYVDGGFRYVGNISANSSAPPRKGQDAPQAFSQPAMGPPTRIRVGGNIQAAQLIHQEPPKYPQEAKQAHIEGTILIHAIIGKDGLIRETDLIQGVCILAEPALKAVKNWRYKPTMLQGNPVEVDTTITVIFTLR